MRRPTTPNTKARALALAVRRNRLARSENQAEARFWDRVNRSFERSLAIYKGCIPS